MELLYPKPISRPKGHLHAYGGESFWCGVATVSIYDHVQHEDFQVAICMLCY